jgi:hypothetical protein
MSNQPDDRKGERSRFTFATLMLTLLGIALVSGGAAFSFGAEPIKGAKVGEWVEYQGQTREGDSYLLRRSVVGEEGGMLWFETRTVRGKETAIMKVLVDPATGRAKRAIVKTPPHPAMEVPLSMAEGMTEGPVRAMPSKEKPIVTQETITTPGGTFKCIHVRDAQSSAGEGVWSSEQIPLGGLVRINRQGHTLVLTAFGTTGAKSEITETPQGMPRPEERKR